MLQHFGDTQVSIPKIKFKEHIYSKKEPEKRQRTKPAPDVENDHVTLPGEFPAAADKNASDQNPLTTKNNSTP